jgi:hypothetical protein
MKLAIFVPLHINEIEDIYMANCQSRFIDKCKQKFEVISVMTIDEDKTNKFDHMNEVSCHMIDMRKSGNYGIVNPTIVSLNYCFDYKPDIIVRITQDTQIIDFDSFVHTIDTFPEQGVVGGHDECSDISDYLAEINIIQANKKYKFVQGNFIAASSNLWLYYKKLPQSVKHYCDDSIFSYLVEYEAGVVPTFVGRWDEQKIWHHNRTKDVYYLESLFRE